MWHVITGCDIQCTFMYKHVFDIFRNFEILFISLINFCRVFVENIPFEVYQCIDSPLVKFWSALSCVESTLHICYIYFV